MSHTSNKKIKARRKKMPKYGETVTISRAPGRNDKCPCGSNKKFKYCCAEKWGV